jgi:hypothetical protein
MLPHVYVQVVDVYVQVYVDHVEVSWSWFKLKQLDVKLKEIVQSWT